MKYGTVAKDNSTLVTQFVLLGLTSEPKLQTPLFIIFLMIYLITLVGNLGLIALIKTNHQLHTPMYFFLGNLSMVDLCYSSVFSPKLLIGFLVEKKTISYPACFAQHFFFLALITTEVLLLAAMAYDRYVAICKPLLYAISMPKRVCIQLVAGSYAGGVLNSLIQTCCLLPLPFCGPNVINHYFCDTNPLLKLACSDGRPNELLLVTFNGTISMSVLVIIIISYVYILLSILRIRSAKGRHKAFSTCASHLLTVTLFYVPAGLSHMQPGSRYSLEMEKVTAVFYTLMVPLLNPLIYSLRNKEVKDALQKTTANNVLASCLLAKLALGS
ncbi:olfactory receptor 1052-like [Egretta garzetta]|uniref:olfactory receptor 1052-like n=1 Tax=Egretta garzetta TaxID=188379 RepID=UPI00163C679D|nr:olfactory receptor 1052-like [Egretta garzetta]